jgi:hypothetical protein
VLTCIDGPTGKVDGTMPWLYQVQTSGQGPDEERCDFCGKTRSLTRGKWLMAGKDGKHICKDCIAVASQLLGTYQTRGVA